MPEISIKDQVGAITYVDDSRHNKAMLEEHMDLPRLREDTAKRITSYYESQGIEVTAEVIDEGVATYFDRRFRFNAPVVDQHSIKGLLARLYISRSNWRGGVVKILIGVALTTVLSKIILESIEYARVKSAASQVEYLAHQKIHDIEMVEDVSAKIQHITARGLRELPPAANEYLRYVNGLQETSARLLDKVQIPHSKVTSINRGEMLISAIQAKQDLLNTEANVTAAVSAIGELQRVLEADSKYKECVSGELFVSSQNKYPALSELATAAEASLQAPARDVHAIEMRVASLSSAIEHLPELKKLQDQADIAISKLRQLNLGSVDWAMVSGVKTVLQEKIQALDTNAASDLSKRLNKLTKYADAKLTLQVVDREGLKSGVERSYSAGGGKSWYLVVEGVDEQGDVVEMPIRNSERGGQWSFRPYYAVRVSQDLFNEVKSEKRATGHVKHRAIGSKERGSLRPIYLQAYNDEPETITEW